MCRSEVTKPKLHGKGKPPGVKYWSKSSLQRCVGLDFKWRIWGFSNSWSDAVWKSQQCFLWGRTCMGNVWVQDHRSTNCFDFKSFPAQIPVLSWQLGEPRELVLRTASEEQTCWSQPCGVKVLLLGCFKEHSWGFLSQLLYYKQGWRAGLPSGFPDT